MSQPRDGDAANDYAALPAHERSAVRAAWAADLTRRRKALDFTAAGMPYFEFDEHRNLVNRHELDASISEAARTIRFGEVLAARGETTVALDEHGRLTRYHPDGTTSPLK